MGDMWLFFLLLLATLAGVRGSTVVVFRSLVGDISGSKRVDCCCV